MALERLLFLGNSITWHGPSEEVCWTGDWGMAASALARDYVHRVASALEAQAGATPQVLAENVADFERGYNTWDGRAQLARWRAFAPDLIVLALGENVTALEDAAAQNGFRDSVVVLLEALARGRRPAILVRSCFWPEPVRDGVLRQACARVGGVFVDIGSLSQVEASFARSEREYAHAGVAAHPGDRGMQGIADLLVAALHSGSESRD